MLYTGHKTVNYEKSGNLGHSTSKEDISNHAALHNAKWKQIKFKSNETHQSNPPLTQNVQSCCFARSDWNPLFAFLVLYGNWEVTTNLIVFKSLFRPNFAFMISIETSVKNHHKGKGVFHFHVFNLPYNRCGAGEGKKIYESKRNWSEEVLS